MNARSTRNLTTEQREALRTALERLIERLRGELERGPLPNHNEDTDDEAVADLETSLEVADLERSSAELKEAVRALRGLDDPAEIQRRLAVALHEMKRYESYRYAIVNDDLGRASAALEAIVIDKRQRRARLEPRIVEILADFERAAR